MLPSHVTMGGHASLSLLEFGVTVSLATQDNNVNKVGCSGTCTQNTAKQDISSAIACYENNLACLTVRHVYSLGII